jgi:hypothetical protein
MNDALRKVQESKQILEFSEFSEDERKERLAIMNSIHNDVTPRVGIFWYQDGKVVGVKKFPFDSENPKEITKPPRATGNVLHKEYWGTAYINKEVHNEPEVAKLYPGEKNWTIVKRGRVWVNWTTRVFEITVGEWFKDFPEAEDKIVKEFNLQDVKHKIIIDKHWNVGCGESGDILA